MALDSNSLMSTNSSSEHSTPAVYELVISAQTEVAPQHFRLKFNGPDIVRNARAGQFVHVLPRGSNTRDPLLRRAFSILKMTDHEFEILYRVSGRGTACMSRWRPGEIVSVLGPLGTPFPSLSPYSLLVGGGVGVPPLAMLASTTREQQVVALLGARSVADIIAREDFTEHQVLTEIATDDGSYGHHGFVTDLLVNKLKEAASGEGIKPVVYSCGPLPMLQRVAAICATFQVKCYVSLEEAMPCGIGVCNGCVVPVTSADTASPASIDGYARYRRICIEGPVLDAKDVDWSAFESNCPV